MVSFIGMLAAMVSMALAMCSLALAVVIYRCVRGIATSRQERQETAQTVPAAAVPAAVVTARGGADGSLGRVIIARWFGRPVVSLDAWSARLVVSCLCAVGGAPVIKPGVCWLCALCWAVPGFAVRDASIGAAMATGCRLGGSVFGALPDGRERAACS